jgi:hypothetical protein
MKQNVKIKWRIPMVSIITGVFSLSSVAQIFSHNDAFASGTTLVPNNARARLLDAMIAAGFAALAFWRYKKRQKSNANAKAALALE